jgi:hypothetical protein
VAGTGAVPLLKDRKRLFRLQRLVARHERNWDTVSAFTVADQLAALNAEVAAKVATVGPRSIVMWRYREDSAMRRTNGGGHQFYSGKARERDSGSIPISANGIDVSGLAKAMMPLLLKQARERNAAFDQRAMDEAVAKLNEKRDDKLR